jgi:hypothetical protein
MLTFALSGNTSKIVHKCWIFSYQHIECTFYLHNTSCFGKIQPVIVEISANSMVEIVESDMDVVKVNKFDLKVFKIGENVYCVEMELLPVLIGMFPSHAEILGYNHQHVAYCRKVLSESFIMVKYRKDQSIVQKTRKLLKKGEMCSSDSD